MSEINVSRTVNAPAEAVWHVITDLERSAEVVSGIDTVERLDDEETFGVGTTWRETRTMFGKQATETMKVTQIDPGRSYTVESEGHGARYVSIMYVTDTGNGTSRITMSFKGEPSGTIARLFASTVGKIFERGTRKALEHDLADIAAAAEQ